MNHTTTVAADFPRMLRVGEAAQFLHVHPNTLRKWSSCGLVPSYRIGSRGDRRFSVSDLVNFLAAGADTVPGAAGAEQEQESDASPEFHAVSGKAFLAAGWSGISPGEVWRS